MRTNIANPRVALVSGQWGQNIGNAFFNLGGRYILERVFGEGQVQFIQDQPGYRTLHNKFRGNPSNYLDFVRRLDIDWLVLQGPVLNSWMRVNWQRTFEHLRQKGVRIMLLSSAFFKFTHSEIANVQKFLEEYPPDLIVTRDARSFDLLKAWSREVPIYSGIDAGFFVSDVHSPFAVDGQPYVVFNFDRYPEPSISLVRPDSGGEAVKTISVGERQWYLSQPRFLDAASRRSKICAYLGDLMDRRKLPGSIDGYEIVRTEHRYFPHMTYKIYRHPNSTASDEPWTYFSIYANAAFTLSDRVHACVATLAYGKPAMLFTPSPRSALLDRAGASRIREELTTIPKDKLDAEKSAMIEWLRQRV